MEEKLPLTRQKAYVPSPLACRLLPTVNMHKQAFGLFKTEGSLRDLSFTCVSGQHNFVHVNQCLLRGEGFAFLLMFAGTDTCNLYEIDMQLQAAGLLSLTSVICNCKHFCSRLG